MKFIVVIEPLLLDLSDLMRTCDYIAHCERSTERRGCLGEIGVLDYKFPLLYSSADTFLPHPPLHHLSRKSLSAQCIASILVSAAPPSA